MKYFIFDMGGVLLKTINEDLLKNENSYVKCNTLEEEKFFLNTFIDYEKGNITTSEYVDILGPFFNKKGLTTDEYEKDYYDNGVKYGGAFPNAFSLLNNLKKEGHKIYLLSNLHETSFKDFSKIFDITIFNELFLSFKLHMVKPNKQIFQYVINKIGDNPCNMFFFDDRKENVDTAIECGINAFVTTGEILEKNINLAKKVK